MCNGVIKQQAELVPFEKDSEEESKTVVAREVAHMVVRSLVANGFLSSKYFTFDHLPLLVQREIEQKIQQIVGS